MEVSGQKDLFGDHKIWQMFKTELLEMHRRGLFGGPGLFVCDSTEPPMWPAGSQACPLWPAVLSWLVTAPTEDIAAH